MCSSRVVFIWICILSMSRSFFFFLNAFESPPKFDDEGNLIDLEAKERLKSVLNALKAFTLRL
ncbi:putative NAD(P)H dehydrogenase (quinone), NADH:ubiquinone reductase (H(+)-translocating) [Helianthus anomalus]